MIFDVDGVLTDGGLIFGEGGEQYKRFNSRDGHGIKMLQESGITAAIITGRTSELLVHRCRDLGIEHLYQGCADKRIAFKSLCEALSLTPAQFAYMGDDVIDLPVMTKVGAALTVADAHTFVIEHADWVSQFNGGYGAAREACELLMQAQGKLAPALQRYLD